ncbi:tyrosine-protein phosphatase non-receptor type substrate 1-like [Callorhinchus milii]|uniref:tyrosine-protein phosphatase non-receptor type substrate 1-like n=1 Tax=Callorhinchus milii TaxID=7868 RepID=UPI001C3F8322|nr:tyrosine-protein phosphatase non-receptor type substrate 1-like [Callorhinchus milii]
MAASVIFNSLFLMVIHSAVSDGTLIEVTQHPKHGIPLVGENITFKCIFAVSPNHTRIKVYWSKHGEDGYLHANDGNRKIFSFEDKGNYSFQLLDVRIQDSGVYYCAVIHEGRESGRGSGSQLTVCVAPTPLNILHTIAEKYSSASTLVCKTEAFYPGNLIFNWYINGTIISTGINITQQQNSDGLYQASSSVGVTQSLQSVYTCMVSHLSLRTEGIANFMIPFSDREYEFPDDYYLLIAGSAVGVLSMLLLLIIGIPLMKSKGKHSKLNESNRNGEQGIQEANNETVAYVSLDLTSSKKSLRPKHP